MRLIAVFRAGLPRYPATVRVTPDMLPRMRRLRYAQIEDMSPPDADGWVTLSVQFETEDEACGYVLGLGPQIEVIEPQALRRKVINSAESIVTLYARKPYIPLTIPNDPDYA